MGDLTCVNWMNCEAIRKEVAEYERKWGAPDGSTNCDNLSDFNITRNCSECNMRPKFKGDVNTILQVLDIFKDPALIALEKVGMKRKCYRAKVETK